MSDAYDEGYEDGYYVGTGYNPYDEGCYEYDEWESGFRDGVAAYDADQDDYYGEDE